MQSQLIRQRLRQANHYIQAAILAFRNDKGVIFSAALAYYGALSVVPLLVMLIAVPGLLLRFSSAPQVVAAEILQVAETMLGSNFRDILERTLNDLQRDSLIATLIATGTLLISSSLVFRYISRCFRFIWLPSSIDADTMTDAVRKTMVTKLLDRLIGVGMALTLSVALVVSVVLNTFLPLLQRILERLSLPLLGEFAGWAIGPATTLSLAMLVFLLLFKYVPPVPMRWNDIWPSALLCAIGWEVGKQALLVYILLIGTRSSYGALSVILAVLFWFNVNGILLFFSAELCKVIAEHRNLLRDQAALGAAQLSSRM